MNKDKVCINFSKIKDLLIQLEQKLSTVKQVDPKKAKEKIVDGNTDKEHYIVDWTVVKELKKEFL